MSLARKAYNSLFSKKESWNIASDAKGGDKFYDVRLIKKKFDKPHN
jgi:hypothetical protein